MTAQSIWSEIKLKWHWKFFFHWKTQFEGLENAWIIKFQVSRGGYFLNCNSTELKRTSKIFFFCSRTASTSGRKWVKELCKGSGRVTENRKFRNKVLFYDVEMFEARFDARKLRFNTKRSSLQMIHAFLRLLVFSRERQEAHTRSLKSTQLNVSQIACLY